MKLPNEFKYWIYVHDPDGDIVKTLGDTNTLIDAILMASDYLAIECAKWSIDVARNTIRIVENSSQSTIWWAGPKPKEWAGPKEEF